jgi:hypothetical protein
MQAYEAPKKMKKVGDLFGKYSDRFKPPQASVEKECILIIKEVAGFTVPLGSVLYTVSNRTIFLKVPSLLKTELRFYHGQILSRLQEKLGERESPKVIL